MCGSSCSGRAQHACIFLMVYPMVVAVWSVCLEGSSIRVAPAWSAACSICCRCCCLGLMHPSAMSVCGNCFLACVMMVVMSLGWGMGVFWSGVPLVGLNMIMTRVDGVQVLLMIWSALCSPWRVL